MLFEKENYIIAYDEYHDNYSNLNLEFSNEEFLSNNKSINLF